MLKLLVTARVPLLLLELRCLCCGTRILSVLVGSLPRLLFTKSFVKFLFISACVFDFSKTDFSTEYLVIACATDGIPQCENKFRNGLNFGKTNNYFENSMGEPRGFQFNFFENETIFERFSTLCVPTPPSESLPKSKILISESL